MTRTKASKLVSVLLIAVMLLAFAAPALADEQVTATTPLNLRSGPGTNYPIVGSLKKGETATRVGTTGGWSILKMGNSRVYTSSNYLTVAGGSAGSSSTMYTTGRVNVRSGPGTGYKVLTTLNKGDQVSVIGTVGKWSIIQWNGGTAYMFTEYLTAKSGGGTGGGTNPSTGTMMATTNVNVRSGPGSNYSKLGMLVKGQKVERTGVSGNWTRVNYNGRTAYVYSSYLKLVTAGGEPDPGFVESASGTMRANITMNVRSGPGTNYSTLGTLVQGETVERTGVIGNWTRITYKGGTAYVFSSYLTRVTGSTQEKMYIKEDTVLRKGPGNSYDRITSLRYGDAVILLERGSTYSKVEYGAYTGYVLTSCLSSKLTQEKLYVIEDAPLLDGPGGTYGRITYLRYGDTVILLERSGSYSKVEYGAYTGYVLTSCLSSSLVQNASGRVYAPSGTDVYDNPGGYRIGVLEPGEGAKRTGTTSGWTRIEWSRGVAYVNTNNVVAFTSSSQTDFTRADKFMYGRIDGITLYTVPSDSSSYRYNKTIGTNDKVYVTGYNSSWIRIEADRRVLYVPTSALKDEISSGGSDLVKGDTLLVKASGGTIMYQEAGLKNVLELTINSAPTTMVPYGTELEFRTSERDGNVYQVAWRGVGYDSTFYVRASDVEKK